MITAQYSSTILIFIMSSSVVQLFLLVLISIVTAGAVTSAQFADVAEPGQFPFLASIRIKGVHKCGGSILNSLFILTAGHCVREARRVNIYDVTVVTGSVRLSAGGYTSYVKKLINATEDGTDPETDVGLIKLTEPLTYDSNTASISLGRTIPNDDYGTVIGWGSTNNKETTALDRLHYMYAYITDLSCTSLYKHNNIICTNNGPKYGVCYGDSGSPLVYGGRIVGVVSRAVLCAKGFPDVFSSIPRNIDFILIKMNTE